MTMTNDNDWYGGGGMARNFRLSYKATHIKEMKFFESKETLLLTAWFSTRKLQCIKHLYGVGAWWEIFVSCIKQEFSYLKRISCIYIAIIYHTLTWGGGLATNFRFLYKDKNFSYITKNIPLFWHCHSLLGGGGEGGGIGGEGGGTGGEGRGTGGGGGEKVI